ncbi:GNAT family N-acetyltransferase [Paenibacillus puerhi]|uniref:GNAT family N-acetyltransferase n=1 Tax=Paenibacillus puerhi TaxID=2692622 RepID=UPI00135C8A53|nr:GNAT family N-acetyltransferase [Paenibacillus puerhi]
MDNLLIQEASDDDLRLLAHMNKQLIEDEQHDNKMNLEQLKERMRSFIQTEYKAYIFKDEEKIRGYALVNHCKEPVYLRHFFICRDSRRNGYGRQYFNELLKILNTDRIDIEVMYWNNRGSDFWKTLGFKERSIYMRLEI